MRAGRVARPRRLHRYPSRRVPHDGQDRLGQHRPNRGGANSDEAQIQNMTDLERLGLGLIGFAVAVVVAGVLLGLTIPPSLLARADQVIE